MGLSKISHHFITKCKRHPWKEKDMISPNDSFHRQLLFRHSTYASFTKQLCNVGIFFFLQWFYMWENYTWETNDPYAVIRTDLFVSWAHIPWATPSYWWVNWLTYEFIFSTSLQISFLWTYIPKSPQLSCIITLIPSSGVCISLVTQKYLLCSQEYIVSFRDCMSSNYLLLKDSCLVT